MLKIPIRDYEHFKEMFIRQVGDRRVICNKPLLAFYKSKRFFELEAERMEDTDSVEKLVSLFFTALESSFFDENCFSQKYQIHLLDYHFWSNEYKLDNEGFCKDGDTNAIRYLKKDEEGNWREWKMKAGKFLRRLIDANPNTSDFPEEVKIFCIEKFVERWKAAAEDAIYNRYELHIDENFHDIYDSSCCPGDFGSCMIDNKQYEFYEAIGNCKAAYLTNARGDIVARAILFEKVYDGTGRVWRLLERQYSVGSKNELKQALVDKCISAGAIDGYKAVGSSCHDARNFVSVNGESLRSKYFYIDTGDYCPERDITSYQDSFKRWRGGYAFNYDIDYCDFYLADTNDRLSSEYCYYYGKETQQKMHEAIFDGERCYVCQEAIDSNFTYCEDVSCYVCDDELSYCNECEDPFYEGVYSDLLGESFCCYRCMQKAEKKYYEEHPEECDNEDSNAVAV